MSFVLGAMLTGCAAPRTAELAGPIVSPANGATAADLPLVRTIVVDAGHGGQDPGATHHGLAEKELTLDIARRLAADLEHAGYGVVMTRQGDQFVALSERAAIANRLPADLFVSIHVNANRDGAVSGAEVYYPRESIVTSQTPLPPGVDEQELAVPTRTLREILWDLVLGRSRSRAFQLATQVCRGLESELQVGCRVKAARFVVLREAHTPAILVEVGYVSNQGEAGRLGREEYREAAARAVARGIEGYGRPAGNGTP